MSRTTSLRRTERGAASASTPASGATSDEETAGRLGLAVLRLARRLRQESPPGITQSQLSALSVINHAGPLAISELAAHENVQPPTMSRIVCALESEGWLERVAEESDRRIALVRVTPKAARELARIRASRNAFLTQRLADLDSDEHAALLAALPALERLVQGADS